MIYGGLSFPFVTPISVSVVRWVVYAILGGLIGVPIAILGTIIWWVCL